MSSGGASTGASLRARRRLLNVQAVQENTANKPPVVRGQAQETFQLSLVVGSGPISDSLHLFIHGADALPSHFVTQKIHLLLHEGALARVKLPSSCSDSCQHLSQRLQGSHKRNAVRQDVVQVNQALLMWDSSKHLVH